MESMIGPALVYLGAALAVVLPGYGSARVVGKLGQVASGIMSEDPGLFGKLLILQALPGTQGIYGLLGWFMIINHTGMLGGNVALSPLQGLLFLLASLPVAFVGLLSAFHQGHVAEGGMALITKHGNASGNAIVLAVMVETYAILALLATILGVLSIAM